ncbi:MAG TPA: HEAT repeat domain-containing protein [Gemmataceae bacterium]|jgi:HEAT repeat protein
MMKKLLLGVAFLLTSLISCRAEEARYAGKPLAFWLEELKSGDALIRDEAIEVLIDAGPAARAAVPQLEALLKDEQLRVRIRAALALWRIAGQTKPAIATLTEALRDRTAPKRAELLIQLGQLGPAAASGAPVVVALINDADPTVRGQAAMTLQRFGAAAVPTILTLFDDADPRVRRDACHALGLLGLLNPPAKDAVSKLTALLKDADAEVRQEALTTLGRQGSFAQAATPAILELTHDKNIALRAASLKALREVFADAKLARPVALEALKDDNALIRCRAVSLLWRVEPKHPDIQPHILELLKQPVGRTELLDLLAAMGPAAADAVPRLTKLLSEPDLNLRRRVIFVLGRMEAAARPAVPALLEQLQSVDPPTRQAVVTALQAIGDDSEQVVPAVLKVAKQDMTMRMMCLPLLANYGAKAGAAVPWLVEELRRPPSYYTSDIAETLHKIDPERARKEAPPILRAMLKPANPWRLRAAMTLRRLEPDSEEALKTLIDCVNNTNGNARQEACRLLGTLGKSARDAAPALRGVLRDAAISNRVVAAAALWKITGETETTVPVLLQAMKPAPDNYWRYQAALYLAEMGPAVKTAALPTLRKYRDDPDPAVRSSVLQAIQRIEGPANKE